MKSKQLFYVLAVVVALLGLGVVASGYGANVVLSAKSGQLSKLKAENEAVQGLQSQLLQSKTQLTTYKDINDIAKSIVPQDKDQTQTVREIVKIAQDSGISRLTSVTFPTSTLGTKNSALTQVQPVSGISGVYALPITVSVGQDNAVTFDQLITFLSGLEHNRRTAQVTSLTITPSDKTNTIAFTLIINEYIKP